MNTTPTHVAAWATIPRDLDINDHSRSRGSMTNAERATAEAVVDLGNGMKAVTYIDSLTAPGKREG